MLIVIFPICIIELVDTPTNRDNYGFYVIFKQDDINTKN